MSGERLMLLYDWCNKTQSASLSVCNNAVSAETSDTVVSFILLFY